MQSCQCFHLIIVDYRVIDMCCGKCLADLYNVGSGPIVAPYLVVCAGLRWCCTSCLTVIGRNYEQRIKAE